MAKVRLKTYDSEMNHKSQKSQILKTIIFLVALVLIGATPVATPNPGFTSAKFGFSISIPEVFEIVPAPSPTIGLLIRAKSGGFPTFNVLTVPGVSEPSTGQSDEQNIVDNYSQVGILDAKVLKSWHQPIAGANSFAAELAYNNSGQTYVSSVAIVPGNGRHYVLTFIDTKANFEGDKALRDQLWATFQASQATIDLEVPAAPSYSGTLIWLACGLLLVLVLVKLIFLNSKRRARP